MKTTFKLIAILLATCAGAHAQVVPAATGPGGLPISGELHYNLNFSQSAYFYGDSQDNQQRSTASGNASYTNVNRHLPFNMAYGGGYSWVDAGAPTYGSVFQHLSVSQGFAKRKWSLTASDNVYYMFETPTTGYSGVPGTGEPIGGSGSSTPSDQTILALNTRIFDNSSSLGLLHFLNYATTFNIGGSLGQMRYPDANGPDNNNTMSADTGISRRLDAHNSVSGQYVFSRFDYIGRNFTSQANTAQFGYRRQWGKRLNTSASVGPQWISSSDSATVPSSTKISGSASVSDTFRLGTAHLSYSHGASNGSGYLLGAETDSVSAGLSREIGRRIDVSATGGYFRTAGLNVNEVTSYSVTNAGFAGAQASRRLGQHISIFANYTAIDQSTSLPASTNILNFRMQVISVGIGYSPRETRLGQ
jgi:hypothetical protein